MNKFILAVVIVSLSSCIRPYKYVEETEKLSMFGGTETEYKDAETIWSSNDSIAYMEAFKKFCISLKVNEDLTEKFAERGLPMLQRPVDFELLDFTGEKVSPIIDREVLKKEYDDIMLD